MRRRFLAALALFVALPAAHAETNDWSVEQHNMYVSLLTRHYSPEPEHNNDQNMLGIEFELPHSRLWGFAVFDNSYGQPSQYLYYGKKWESPRSDRWYLKVTGGLLHGYKGEYEDKIPLNNLGIAPGVIPALGYRRNNFFVEFVQLGFSAGMINIGRTF